MRKFILFISFMGCLPCTFSQTAQVVGPFQKFDDACFSNVDKSNAFYFKSSAIPFSLKRINSSGNLVNEFTKAYPSDVFGLESMELYEQKGIGRLVKLPISDTIYKFWLYNGITIDSISLPFIRTGFDPAPKPKLNATHAYIFDERRIYKTNYTAIGTSTMFTSTLINKLTSLPIQLEENNGIVYFVDIGNYPTDPAFANRRYILYKYQGGILSLIDSTDTGYINLHKNVASGEVYAFKYTNFVVPDNSIIHFDMNGNITKREHLNFHPYVAVKNKILGSRLSNSGVNLGVGHYNWFTQTMDSVLYIPSMVMHYKNVVSNGNVSYFMMSPVVPTDYFIFHSDGDSVKQISNWPYHYGTNWPEMGTFCGDNFWSYKHFDTGFSFSIDSFIEQYTPTGVVGPIYTPNDTMDYYISPVSDNQYIYYSGYHSDDISFPSTLYRYACGWPTSVTQWTPSEDNISLSPNPAAYFIKINTEKIKLPLQAEIIDMYGCLQQKVVLQQEQTFVDISQLAPGLYILKAGINMPIKFVKE